MPEASAFASPTARPADRSRQEKQCAPKADRARSLTNLHRPRSARARRSYQHPVASADPRTSKSLNAHMPGPPGAGCTQRVRIGATRGNEHSQRSSTRTGATAVLRLYGDGQKLHDSGVVDRRGTRLSAPISPAQTCPRSSSARRATAQTTTEPTGLSRCSPAAAHATGRSHTACKAVDSELTALVALRATRTTTRSWPERRPSSDRKPPTAN
jgi:hypothetical protein